MKHFSFLFVTILLLLSPLLAKTVSAQSDVPTIFYCVGSDLGPPCATVAPTENVQTPTSTPEVSVPISVTPTIFQIDPTDNPEPTSSENPSPTTSSPAASPTTIPCDNDVEVPDSQESSASGQVQTMNKKDKEDKEDNDDHKKKKKHHKKKGILQQIIEFLLKLIKFLLQHIGLYKPTPCAQPTVTPTISPSVTVAEPTKQFCTDEAKACPDGSYVGRTGPNCTFPACPTANPSVDPTDTPLNCAKILTKGRNSFTHACESFINSCLPKGWIKDTTCR